MNIVNVTVSGEVGVGKSAIAGEIEILCKALGLEVEWIDGDDEKRLTHADWTEALEMYRPHVVIREQITTLAAREDGWRPIESAPLRDAVIVHRKGQWTRLACMLESGEWMQWPGPVGAEPLAYVPTHWQPLPAAPPAQGTGEG